MSDVPSSAWEAHLQAQQLMAEELRAAHAARIAEKDERIQELLREVSRLQEQHREEKSRLEEQHREEKSRLEAQLAAALGRNERLLQAFQEGVERESRERDDMRDAAERNQRDLAKEWRDRLEGEQERWAAERARLSGRIQDLEARPDVLTPTVQQIATLVQKQVIHNSINAELQLLVQEEAQGRQTLTSEAAAARRALERQRGESLKQLPAREAARAEAVFAARGLSMSQLRRTHLGKGLTNGYNSYAAGEGLYNLFLALRPGGPVDRFAMRGLLKGEVNATALWFRTNNANRNYPYTNQSPVVPTAEAYELVSQVLCHLPALRSLRLTNFPPLSTHSLEWVAHLPRCMQELRLEGVSYTAADLREMHRRRGRCTFTLYVSSNQCTDWGELRNSGIAMFARTELTAELGGMISWT